MQPDRRFNGSGRKYQIQQLWDLHHEIIRLALLGWKHLEIARELGVTGATVSNCLNSEIGRRHLELMRNARDAESIDLATEIRNNAPRAFKLLMELMDDDTTATKERIAIAMDNLNRAGYMPPKVVEGHFIHAHLTRQEIDEIKSRARESGMMVLPSANEAEIVEIAEVAT